MPLCSLQLCRLKRTTVVVVVVAWQRLGRPECLYPQLHRRLLLGHFFVRGEIYTYIHTYISMHMCIHAYTNTSLPLYTAYMLTYTYTFVHRYAYIYIHTLLHMYINICIYIYIHIDIHRHVYIGSGQVVHRWAMAICRLHELRE